MLDLCQFVPSIDHAVLVTHLKRTLGEKGRVGGRQGRRLSSVGWGRFSLLSTALERGFGDQAPVDSPAAERGENLCRDGRIGLSIDIV